MLQKQSDLLLASTSQFVFTVFEQAKTGRMRLGR